MDKFVLPVIFVCLVLSHNINWGVNGMEEDTRLDDLHNIVKNKFHSITESDRLLEEKCFNRTQSKDNYKKILNAMKEFEKCDVSLVKIERQICVAKHGDDHNMVFKKYCDMPKYFKFCYALYLSKVNECLDDAEKNSTDLIPKVLNSFESIVCQNNQFFSEGGPKCIFDKLKPIEHCLNTTIVKYIPRGEQSLTSLLAFKFGENQCMSMSELQVCVIAELEKCGSPTPANIIESLFEFVCRSTPCSKFQSAQIRKKSAGVSLHATISITALSSLSILLGLIGFY